MKLKLLVISLILLINVGFAFTLLLSTFYQSEDSTDSKFSVLDGLLTGELKSSEEDVRKIIQLLKQDENIEDKAIMTSFKTYPYHTNSKLIYTQFTEGSPDDTIEDFITKKNWSAFEHYYSAINSIPPQNDLDMVQIPDYLIYNFSDTVIDPTTTWYVDAQIFYIHSLLANPEDPNIPEFFESIYYSPSGRGGTVVYKINM